MRNSDCDSLYLGLFKFCAFIILYFASFQIHEPVQGVLRQVSTTAQIKSLLERWEEPVNKMDKESDPTVRVKMLCTLFLWLD